MANSILTTDFSRVFGPSKLAALDLRVIKKMGKVPDPSRHYMKHERMSTDLLRHYIPTGAPMPSELQTELQTVSTKNVIQGPYAEYVTTDYGIAVGFSHVFRREDKHGLLGRILDDVAGAMSYHRCLGPAQILNTAFAGKLWRDGKTLCATDHPLYGGPDSYSTTGVFSNRMSAAAMTQGSIELMITQGMGVVDEMGYMRMASFGQFICDRTQWAKAHEILMSPDRSDTASRAKNILKFAESGLPTIRVNKFLDPNIGYFLAASAEDSQAYVFNREGPYRDSWLNKGNREQVYAMFYSRSIGVTDFRWIIGTPFS